MSVTLGSYSSLPDPVSATTEVAAPGAAWEMADGSEVAHFLTTRYVWKYTWRGTTSAMADVITACEAAIVATKTFKPYDTSTTYTTRVDPGSLSVKFTKSSREVSATIRETTA
jgi:hypothetical protein